MPELVVRLDRGVYLEEAVFAAAHRLSDEFAVAVDEDGSDWIISLRSSKALPNDLAQRVKLGVVDEMLRVFARQKSPIFEAFDAATNTGPGRRH